MRSCKALLLMGFCTLLGWRKVQVDRLHMFSCSAILLALCFDEIALWCSCLLYDGPRDVFITCWRPEKDFLAWGEFW